MRRAHGGVHAGQIKAFETCCTGQTCGSALCRIPEPLRKQFGLSLRCAVVLAHRANEAHVSPNSSGLEIARFLTHVKAEAVVLDKAYCDARLKWAVRIWCLLIDRVVRQNSDLKHRAR